LNLYTKYLFIRFSKEGSSVNDEVVNSQRDQVIGFLKLDIVEAKDLPKMDLGLGKCDPFVVLRMDGSNYTFKTTTKYKTYTPVWNESFLLPV
jgi:Ca2+-dependent lipid-binding protein